MTLRPRELLERLDRALARNGGAVELSAAATHQGTTRFANSRVTQTGEVEDAVVQARVALGARVGAVRSNALDPDAIDRAIAQAGELAAAQPEDPDFDGFDDGKQPTTELAPTFDEAAAAADASIRAQLVEPAFRLTGDRMSAAGLAAIQNVTLAVATSAGCRRAHHHTVVKLDVIAQVGAVSARTGRCHFSLSAVDPVATAHEACERAERGRDPIELAPGAYDVILEPAAIAEALEWLALTSLGGRTVQDGSSCLAGRFGTAITGPVTILDDPLGGDDGCPTVPFDSEGTPTKRLVFIDEGIARACAHDRATAHAAAVSPTGHAPPIGDELFDSGPMPQHLRMGRGVDTVEDLLARVERGLWVSRFHYVNGLLDPRRALMTGMTRDGLFLIENGRITRGVRNLRWTESLLEALTRLGGITRDRRVVSASLGDGLFVCPTLLIRGWHFTAGQ